jgi:hypothetical protein
MKDRLVKALSGTEFVPAGLVELNRYFRMNGPINFDFHLEDGLTVAVSKDFRFGSIVAHGRDEAELDRNIKDAILTSFAIPSAYAKEAGLQRVGKESRQYALA